MVLLPLFEKTIFPEAGMPEVLVLDLGLSGLVDLEAPRRAIALWDAREAQSSLLMGSVPMQATPEPLGALRAGAPDPLPGVCHYSPVPESLSHRRAASIQTLPSLFSPSHG